MKKLFFYTIVTIASSCFADYSSLQKEKYQVLTVNELIRSDLFSKMKNMSKEEMEKYLFNSVGKNTVVVFEKGAKFPLKLSLEGDFFSIESNDTPYVTIHKNFYLRCKDDQFLFSLDLIKWQEAAIFFTGESSLSIGAKEDMLPYITLQAKLNKR